MNDVGYGTKRQLRKQLNNHGLGAELDIALGYFSGFTPNSESFHFLRENPEETDIGSLKLYRENRKKNGKIIVELILDDNIVGKYRFRR